MLTTELAVAAMDLHVAGVDPDALTAALALLDKLDESGEAPGPRSRTFLLF
jgi:hypothetical protein